MATYFGKFMIDGEDDVLLVGSTLYGVCGTDKATNAKTVTIHGFDALMTGVTIHMKLTNGNSATRPTLNVSDTGAKDIRVSDGTYGLQDAAAGSVHALTFDGSAWVVNS